MSAVADLAFDLAGTSDGALVRAHRRGREEAFEVIYRRYHGRLVAYCTAMTGDPALGEDLAHDALLRALRYGSNFDPSRPLWPWLKTIARNVITDHSRRRSSSEIAVDLDSGAPADELVDDDQTGEIELREVLERAMDGLCARHRTVLELRYLEDRSREESADILGLNRNGVDQLIHRAITRLRDEYARLTDASVGALALVPFPRLRTMFARLRVWAEQVPQLAQVGVSAQVVAGAVAATAVVAFGMGASPSASEAASPALDEAVASSGSTLILDVAPQATVPVARTTTSTAETVETAPPNPPRTAIAVTHGTGTGDAAALHATGSDPDDSAQVEASNAVRVGDRETDGRAWIEVDCRPTLGGAACEAYGEVPPVGP